MPELMNDKDTMDHIVYLLDTGFATDVYDFLQEQKKAHADMVIGEDIKEKYSNEPYERIKQHEIKAVNRKLTEQRERNQ